MSGVRNMGLPHDHVRSSVETSRLNFKVTLAVGKSGVNAFEVIPTDLTSTTANLNFQYGLVDGQSL
jgi:hypothetical protein